MPPRHLSITIITFGLVACGTTGCVSSTTQTDDQLRSEIAAVRQEQQEIRKVLTEIKELLQREQRPPTRPRGPDVAGKVFDLGNNPVKGSASAPVVLLEFTDYQCPYCLRHTQQTQPQIEKTYVDSGKIRFVSFDMPIPNLHPLAFKASEASHCAEDQGQFWQMRERLFANQRSLEPWNAHAEALGLDVARFEACLSSGKYREAVRRDMAEASKAGASGTPSFVIARADDNDPGKAHGLQFLRGAQPYAAFQRALDEALASVAKEQMMQNK